MVTIWFVVLPGFNFKFPFYQKKIGFAGYLASVRTHLWSDDKYLVVGNEALQNLHLLPTF